MHVFVMTVFSLEISDNPPQQATPHGEPLRASYFESSGTTAFGAFV